MHSSNIWSAKEYRPLLKERVHRLKREGRELSFASLAQSLGLQQSYLSRSLHHPKTHLNDDHFDELMHSLEFSEDEMEFLRLLRECELSALPKRRERLGKKLESLRKMRLTQTVEKSHRESSGEDLEYVCDPYHVIVHVALNIPAYAQNPMDLHKVLPLSQIRLKQILENLERSGYIERNRRSPFEVSKVLQSRIHFGKDHPLMATHQTLFRSLSTSYLQGMSSSKKSFSVTLSSDEGLLAEVETCFSEFIDRLKKASDKYPSQHVYQLNFDFFPFL